MDQNYSNSESSEELQPSPSTRKLSGLPAFISHAAAGIGSAVVRTIESAGMLVTDAEIRKRAGGVVADGASKGLKGIQHGIQTGANTIQRGLYTVGQGPRQIQSVLQRISQQIEEQRMRILLEEQRDAPVDVQIGFQVYEDAPQELRSRLWMVLLEHPELIERYQAVQRADLAAAEEAAAVAAENKANVEEEKGKDAAAGSVSEEPKLPAASNNEPILDEQHQISAPAPLSNSVSTDAAPSSELAAASGEDWEVVGDRGARRWRQGQRLLSGGSLHRTEPWTPAKESFRQELMADMTALPWPLPTEADPESRYSTLLQISIGQEEIDDVISRDIHRTFPEYPLFGFEQGQQALFKVLKAYSLHDLETGYCQGMAFVAGLLLFFVPEEAAFQIFCRLLAASGPGLRRHYLPGLRGLKVELRVFEILLGRYLPNLKAHLEAQGAVPVLYASQWFLSAFACPFPVGFACRLVDVMLVENSDRVLMRTALAVMAECEAELMMQEDFEELLTYLKVEPVQWSTHRLRRVLNAAILDSPISNAEMAEVAREAESEENPLSIPTVAKRDEDKPTTTRAANVSPKKQSPRGAEAGQGEEESREDGGGGEAEKEEEGDADDQLTAELAQHQAELDTAYVQMVLDLDNLWGGAGEESVGAVEAYENALAAQGRGAGGGTEGDLTGQSEHKE